METKYQKKQLGARTLSFRVKAVREFLEVNDVPINHPQWKQKIRTPRPIQRESNPITKEEIRTLLQNTESPELKTYLLFLASTDFSNNRGTNFPQSHIVAEQELITGVKI